jgi:dCMP deaminase
MRPHIFSTYSKIVEALAERSTCTSRISVGALFFDDDGRIIATGYNGTPRGYPHCDEVGCNLDKDGHCQNSIHAEENAILQCAVIGRSTNGLSLFCTHLPCWRCSLRLVQAGIKHVIYEKSYGSRVQDTITLFNEYGVTVDQYVGRNVQ